MVTQLYCPFLVFSHCIIFFILLPVVRLLCELPKAYRYLLEAKSYVNGHTLWDEDCYLHSHKDIHSNRSNKIHFKIPIGYTV